MGVEDFQVVIDADGSKYKELAEYLETLPEIKRVRNAQEHLPNVVYFNIEEKNSIIELELDKRDANRACQLSIRYALCQAKEVESRLISLVRGVLEKFSLSVRISDSLDSEVVSQYNLENFDEFVQNVLQSMTIKRQLWIDDFGDETVRLNCTEAIAYFISKSSR